MGMRKVILQPIAMREPQLVDKPRYELSRLEESKTVSEAEFLEKYADQARSINVNDKMTTAYGNAYPELYIVAGEAK